jgi:hypothetical protein
MKDPVDRAIRAIARRNSYALAMAERTDVALRGKQAAVRLWAPSVQGSGACGRGSRAESVAD